LLEALFCSLALASSYITIFPDAGDARRRPAVPADELAMSAPGTGNAQTIWDERYGDVAEPPPLDQGGYPIHYTLHKFR